MHGLVKFGRNGCILNVTAGAVIVTAGVVVVTAGVAVAIVLQNPSQLCLQYSCSSSPQRQDNTQLSAAVWIMHSRLPYRTLPTTVLFSSDDKEISEEYPTLPS